MTSAVLSGRFNDHGFVWALVLSVALHVLIVSTLHPFRFDAPVPAPALEIELQPPKPEPPPPPPEVVKPQEPPTPEPPPVSRPLPKKPLPEPLPKMPDPAPEAPQVETAPPPPPPTVIAAAPKVEQPPAFTAPPPPPDPPKPVEPAPEDINAARNNYGSLLAREFAKHRQYPRIAQMRGWQGTTRVQLEIDAGGSVVSATVSESSGHEVLDKQALEMVRKASPLPLPPEALRNRQFTILVPVTFRLE